MLSTTICPTLGNRDTKQLASDARASNDLGCTIPSGIEEPAPSASGNAHSSEACASAI
jgi:hypothetical protein